MENILNGLNPAQLQAVVHNPNIPLQILAGPGSGKTKVLTSRIAYLILKHSLKPQSICAVTFTNKAANEMRERLKKLLGPDVTAQIRMGTFHSLCVMFLRRYSQLVGINHDFTVCATDDSKKIMAKLLKQNKAAPSARHVALKEETVLSLISKAKAKGLSPNDIMDLLTTKTRTKKSEKSDISALIDDTHVTLYREYEDALRDSNSLDFDDLLVYGVKLFRRHPKVRQWCEHILVDEFQDTNTMQYRLMRYIAAANNRLTIVGDPDQSIYGWRSAEVENLARMQNDFPSTVQILLEHNYRSTGAILQVSAAIIAQDTSRIPKTLRTQHELGPIPCLQTFPSEYEEADFIASEIKKQIADTGGLLEWKDFVILLRGSAQSRTIESALQKQRIPNRVLAGHKFFERAEVKDVLAYLQVVDNPQFVPAFSRAINTPARGIGEKSVSELLSKAVALKKSPLETAEGISDGHISDIKPSVKHKLKWFIETVRELRRLANGGESPSSLIRTLLDMIDYKAHLQKTQPDADNRWENVQELINFAKESEMSGSYDQHVPQDAEMDADWDEPLDEFDRDAFEEDGIVEMAGPSNKGSILPEGETPLRLFLQATMLSTDTQSQDGQVDNNKVTISTCHAAKGLEWPVVFIAAVEKGTFPSALAEDIEEERRLLYVASTRAQGLLYFTHTTKRMISGDTKPRELSEFLSVVRGANRALLADYPPQLSTADRVLLATVLRREPVDEAMISRTVEEHNRRTRETSSLPRWNDRVVQQSSVDQSHYATSYETASPPASYSATFSSARVIQNVSGQSHSTSRIPLSPRRPSVVNTAPSQSASKPKSKSTTGSKPSSRSSSRLDPNQGTLITFLKPSSGGPVSQNGPLSGSSQNIAPPEPPTTVAAQPGVDTSSSVPPKINGIKRRLGMGHSTAGYANKKYKPPT